MEFKQKEIPFKKKLVTQLKIQNKIKQQPLIYQNQKSNGIPKKIRIQCLIKKRIDIKFLQMSIIQIINSVNKAIKRMTDNLMLIQKK